jgi:hypothetical protein
VTPTDVRYPHRSLGAITMDAGMLAAAVEGFLGTERIVAWCDGAGAVWANRYNRIGNISLASMIGVYAYGTPLATIYGDVLKAQASRKRL